MRSSKTDAPPHVAQGGTRLRHVAATVTGAWKLGALECYLRLTADLSRLALGDGRLGPQRERREQDRRADEAGRDEECELVAAGERRCRGIAVGAQRLGAVGRQCGEDGEAEGASDLHARV